MEKIKTLIIGGGAAGLTLATLINSTAYPAVVLERGDRVGKKLSATGNGQGNVTNVSATDADYFSSSKNGKTLAQTLVSRHSHTAWMQHLQNLGLLLITDERGRVYPAGRQASAVTDALRFTVAQKGIDMRCGWQVTSLQKQANGFFVTARNKDGATQTLQAETVVLCTGGSVAKQFGTDGSAYALAAGLGHTLTQTYPSLVQLKADTTHTKTLKGIRVSDAVVTAAWDKLSQTLQGDLLFTDYGVSGDVIFRLSAFFAHRLQSGVTLTVDFLPDFDEESIYQALIRKRENYPAIAIGELLCGFVNNQLARAIMKRAQNDCRAAAKLIKAFTISVKGSMGADVAQVTKGGVSMDEVDENLQSKKCSGLYFAGEILDVDGQCGGYNLQWAYSSACAVANALNAKGRGLV